MQAAGTCTERTHGSCVTCSRSSRWRVEWQAEARVAGRGLRDPPVQRAIRPEASAAAIALAWALPLLPYGSYAFERVVLPFIQRMAQQSRGEQRQRRKLAGVDQSRDLPRCAGLPTAGEYATGGY